MKIRQFCGRSVAAIELGHCNDVIRLEMVGALIGSIRFWSRVLTQYALGIFAYPPPAGG
jgi:hypothetical protein